MENDQPRESLGKQGNRPAYRFFLSHNSDDKKLVRDFHAALAQRGVTAWFDEKNLPPTEIPVTAIPKGIGESEVCLVFLGCGGAKAWQSWEIQHAVQRAVDRKMPIVTISLMGGPEREKRPDLLSIYSWLDFRSGWTDAHIARLCDEDPSISLKPANEACAPVQESSV